MYCRGKTCCYTLSNAVYLNESNSDDTKHGVIDNDGVIKLTGNWTNNATAATNVVFRNFDTDGSVQFIGNAIQKIRGTKITNFEKLVVNNTFDGDDAVTLRVSPVVRQSLTLTDGVVETGTNYMIISNTATAAVTVYSNASFVNGNMRRYFASGNDYKFPLGNGYATNNFYLAEISSNTITGVDYVDASFAAKQGTDIGLNVTENGTAYSTVSTAGIWYIIPHTGPSGGSFDLKLSTVNVNAITPLSNNQFAILNRVTSSSSAVDWSCDPCGVGSPGLNANGELGRMVGDGYALRKGMTAFGQYGIGLMEGNLPISLLSFSGICRSNSIEINWSTASETNNQFFVIEKSSNINDWAVLATINGAGNSNSLISYHYTDQDPFSGNTYYRLKQIDFNGDYSYSGIISVSCSSALQSSYGIISYQVEDNSIEILINSEKEEAYNVSIYDMLGKKVFHSNKTVSKGLSNLTLTTPNFVESFYLLELRSNRQTISKKILLF